jgi:hypothetical protein
MSSAPGNNGASGRQKGVLFAPASRQSSPSLKNVLLGSGDVPARDVRYTLTFQMRWLLLPMSVDKAQSCPVAPSLPIDDSMQLSARIR